MDGWMEESVDVWDIKQHIGENKVKYCTSRELKIIFIDATQHQVRLCVTECNSSIWHNYISARQRTGNLLHI